ncbi:hypothetical protein FC093_03450 [Ilyomonas limi]|uniref:Uncharacterized protein n=1 Tax=Ilyomonas limi TaxID=2575867 RepID=A0A4U3L6X2_9BACT|nr:hypothetical protein [Ilyomonas limi]TKK70762.1 hypothetical protein FC093_03450 [Ilyomonas limi]
MKPKTVISLFCIIVLLFQVLPVQQLGSMLYNNQIQEELPHGGTEIGKYMKGKPDFKKDFCCTHYFAGINYIYTNATSYIHFATALPLSQAGDIQTPPPNIIPSLA